jgi:hypothetical protein
MIRSTFACTTALILGTTLLAGCAGTATSGFSYNESTAPNRPTKAEGCYDASVLLARGLGESKGIAKKALAAIDVDIATETATTLAGQRNRHVGVFVGSGGEELAVTVKEVSPARTFVTVTTKTGFVGGAGQKAWSCEVVDSIVSLATK